MIHKTHASKLSEWGPASFRTIVACSWLVLGACGKVPHCVAVAGMKCSENNPT
jgi:hypothetical protein